jgi:flagellar biosynthesis protein FlhF
MIIKSFAAETAAAALKQVRREMGGEAIVLKTRQLADSPGGARVEVTACLEAASAFQSSQILSSRLNRETFASDPVQSPGLLDDPKATEAIDTEPLTPSPRMQNRLEMLEHKLDRLITVGRSPSAPGEATACESLRYRLADADLSDDFIAATIGAVAVHPSASSDPDQAAREILVARLAELMEPDLSFDPGHRVVFVGPAGAGKSTLMGKLAARLTILEKKKVVLVSLDKCKLAAGDEVRRYADVLNVDLIEPTDFHPGIEFAEDAITLIDSPALSAVAGPRDQLAEIIDAIAPQYRIAVFSSLMRRADALALAENMIPLAPTHLAVTMTDMTDRIGAAVSIAEVTGWKIAMIGDTPGGIGQIRQPDPDRAARLILQAEVSGD